MTSNDFVLDPRYQDIMPVGFTGGGIESQSGILIVKMRKNQVRQQAACPSRRRHQCPAFIEGLGRDLLPDTIDRELSRLEGCNAEWKT